MKLNGNVFSGRDLKYGLTDYISAMALPTWVWTEELDFPRLYSWSKAARDEMFSFFNYDTSLRQRDFLELIEPDFENFSLPDICGDNGKTELANYCQLAEDIPDIFTTMNLMNLAKFPQSLDETFIKGKIK